VTGLVQQLAADDLKAMTPEQIVEAYQGGRMQTLLSGGRAPRVEVPADGQMDAEHLQSMTPDQIVEAHAAGRFDNLLGRGTQT
jgi:hypothetical protein